MYIYIHIDEYMNINKYTHPLISYGVATIGRLLKIIGLFLQNIVSFIGFLCKRGLKL